MKRVRAVKSITPASDPAAPAPSSQWRVIGSDGTTSGLPKSTNRTAGRPAQPPRTPPADVEPARINLHEIENMDRNATSCRRSGATASMNARNVAHDPASSYAGTAAEEPQRASSESSDDLQAHTLEMGQQLAHVMQSWANLSSEIRAAILAVVQASAAIPID